MKHFSLQLRSRICLLLAAIILLPLAGKLQVCIGEDHLGLMAANAAELCCEETSQPEAMPVLSAAKNEECGNCVDLQIPETQLPARLSAPMLTPQPALQTCLSVLTLSVYTPAPVVNSHPIAPDFPLPVQAGTLLRV